MGGGDVSDDGSDDSDRELKEKKVIEISNPCTQSGYRRDVVHIDTGEGEQQELTYTLVGTGAAEECIAQLKQVVWPDGTCSLSRSISSSSTSTGTSTSSSSSSSDNQENSLNEPCYVDSVKHPQVSARLSRSRRVFYSIRLAYYFMWSGALDSSGVLLP